MMRCKKKFKGKQSPKQLWQVPRETGQGRDVFVTCARPVGEESYFELCVSVCEALKGKMIILWI